jgi:hypothetical protein
MKLLATIIALPIVICLAPSTIFASGQSLPLTVYDSIDEPHGGWFLGGSRVLGQSVTLAGNARLITQIELLLWGRGGDQFWIRFYDLEGLGTIPPGVAWDSSPKVIWESPLQVITEGGPNIFSVPVPRVLVPDTVGWAVAPIEIPTSNPGLPGVLPAPKIGTRNGIFGLSTNFTWHTAISDWTFGARLVAVPEQSAGALAVIAFGGATFAGRRRRRL